MYFPSINSAFVALAAFNVFQVVLCKPLNVEITIATDSPVSFSNPAIKHHDKAPQHSTTTLSNPISTSNNPQVALYTDLDLKGEEQTFDNVWDDYCYYLMKTMVKNVKSATLSQGIWYCTFYTWGGCEDGGKPTHQLAAGVYDDLDGVGEDFVSFKCKLYEEGKIGL